MPATASSAATPSQKTMPMIRFTIVVVLASQVPAHYPRHRSLSTDLAVRNSPNVMKLR